MRWLIASLLCIGCASGARGSVHDCEYRLAGERSFRALPSTTDLPDDVEESSGELQIACALPPITFSDPALSLSRGRTLRAASVDGRAIALPAWPPRMVPLEREHGGETIVLTFARLGLHPPGEIAIGSREPLLRSRIARELPAFCGGALLVFAGIAFAAVGVRRSSRKEYAWLALFSISMGASFIASESTLATTLYPDPRAWRWVVYANLFLYPLGLAHFLAALLDARSGRRLRVLSIALAALLPIFAALHVLDVATIYATHVISYVLLLPMIVLTIGPVVRRVREGAGAARIVLIGFAVMTIVGLPDILWGAGLIPPPPVRLSTPAVIAFAAAMAFALERWERDERGAREASARELSARVEELELRRRENEQLDEELRQQIARRSRELRELLARETPAALDEGAQIAEGAVIDGRYRVVRKLGAGGMGAVFEVERVRDARRLALKLMRGSASPEHVARFTREAEIAANVRHSNVVGVVDVGVTPHGLLYLVMELVDGRDLDHARDRFGDAAWARAVLRQIADGLAALHARGIVHRDLKPANVLLARAADGSETARIADFGIARQNEEALALANTMDAASQLTRAGVLIGTPLYMAPETARAPATPAADVFSLALVAHELLYGAHPFPTPPVLLALSGERLPSPAMPERDGIPSELRALLVAALDEDPSRRPTAADIAARALVDR